MFPSRKEAEKLWKLVYIFCFSGMYVTQSSVHAIYTHKQTKILLNYSIVQFIM
jgi:hypothetical protein